MATPITPIKPVAYTILLLLLLTACSPSLAVDTATPQTSTVQPVIGRVASPTPAEPSTTPRPTSTRLPVFSPTPTETFAPTETASLSAVPSETPAPTLTPSALPFRYISGSSSFSLPAVAISEQTLPGAIPLAVWGAGQIEQVARLPGDRVLIVRTTRGVGVYDSGTLEALWFRPVVAGPLAVSPDGNLLALMTRTGVELWRVGDGTFLRQLDISGSMCLTAEECTWPEPNLDFSPDGRILAAIVQSEYVGGPEVRRVWLWQIPDGTWMGTIQGNGPVSDLLFSPDRAILALRAYDSIELWRISDRTMVRSLSAGFSKGPVETFDFSPDGSQLAARYADEAYIWRIADGRLMTSIDSEKLKRFAFDLWWALGPASLDLNLPEGFFGPVSGDANLIGIYVERNEAVEVWDIRSNSLFRLLNTGWLPWWPGAPSPIFFSGGSANLVAVAPDGLKLWNVQEARLMRSNLWGGEGGDINQVSGFSHDGSSVFLSGWSGGYQVRVQDGELLYAAAGLLIPLPGGGGLELRRSGEHVEVFRIGDSRRIYSLRNAGDIVVAWITPDGNILATCARPYTSLALWRASDGGHVATLDTGLFVASAFSPDGSQIATTGSLSAEQISSDSLVVRLWRAVDGNLMKVFSASLAEVLAFSPDGKLLAVNARAGGVRIYRMSDDALTGTLPLSDRFQGSPATCSSAVFSKDGELLVCGSPNGKLLFWRLSDGSLMREFQAHAGRIQSMALSPDGKILVTAGNDSTVRLWGVSP